MRKDFRSARIMVIDDDRDVLQIIINTLKGRYGFDVIAFTNPAEALHELQRSHNTADTKPYSIVVSDVRMPQMSGFELAARVKEMVPKLTVILMTAFEVQEQELSRGTPILPYEEILAKPFSLHKLCEYIKKHLPKE